MAAKRDRNEMRGVAWRRIVESLDCWRIDRGGRVGRKISWCGMNGLVCCYGPAKCSEIEECFEPGR